MHAHSKLPREGERETERESQRERERERESDGQSQWSLTIVICRGRDINKYKDM
jgi:hypothetical protein